MRSVGMQSDFFWQATLAVSGAFRRLSPGGRRRQPSDKALAEIVRSGAARRSRPPSGHEQGSAAPAGRPRPQRQAPQRPTRLEPCASGRSAVWRQARPASHAARLSEVMSQLSGISGRPSRRSSGSQTGTPPSVEDGADRSDARCRHESVREPRKHLTECRHGEERHPVRGPVVEADPLLLAPDAVGERTAAWHDRRSPAACLQGTDDVVEPGISREAAADLDDRQAQRVSRSPWSSMASTGFCSPAWSARSMVSSTPTPPGPISSFSTFTVTRPARGSPQHLAGDPLGQRLHEVDVLLRHDARDRVGDEVIGIDLPHAVRLAARPAHVDGHVEAHFLRRGALVAVGADPDRQHEIAHKDARRLRRDRRYRGGSRARRAGGSRHCPALPGAAAE